MSSFVSLPVGSRFRMSKAKTLCIKKTALTFVVIGEEMLGEVQWNGVHDSTFEPVLTTPVVREEAVPVPAPTAQPTPLPEPAEVGDMVKRRAPKITAKKHVRPRRVTDAG